MNQKSILILTAATLAVCGIAAIKLSSNEASVASKNTNEKLLPQLESSVNDVASMTLQKGAASYTIAKSDAGWGLTEKGGYPADMESVRKTLIALSGMTLVEAKTDDPARYTKLGVQEPETEGSTSTLVTLKDKSGKELAKLIVGKQSESHGTPSGSTYVRKAGDKQSWLVKGDPALKEKDTDWLEKKILEIKRDRIKSVEIKHPDGEVVHVERGKAEDQNFELANIPEGQELSYPSAAGSITSTLEYLNLEDVLPADKVDFTQGAGATSEFRTFDGLKVTVRIKEDGEKCYGRFEVAFEPAPEIGPTPPPAAEKKEGETPADPTKPADAKKKPEEVRKEAEELQKRLAPWVFVIPSYNKASFTKHMKDLVKPKTPPAAPAPPGGEGKQEGEDEGAYVIPDNLPPEIQAQIKAHQESLGHKTKVVPAPKSPEEGGGDTSGAETPNSTPPKSTPPAGTPPNSTPPAGTPPNNPPPGGTPPPPHPPAEQPPHR